MIILAGHLKTSPDLVEELAAALQSLVPATLLEDGCLAYHFAIDDKAAGSILVYERWRDQDALNVHLALPAIGAVLGDSHRPRCAADRVGEYPRWPS